MSKLANRHCERSEAISILRPTSVSERDCFVASLLAMTLTGPWVLPIVARWGEAFPRIWPHVGARRSQRGFSLEERPAMAKVSNSSRPHVGARHSQRGFSLEERPAMARVSNSIWPHVGARHSQRGFSLEEWPAMARVSNSSRFSRNASPLHCAIRAKKPSKYLTSARLSHTIVVCGTQERPCDWLHIGAFYAFASGRFSRGG